MREQIVFARLPIMLVWFSLVLILLTTLSLAAQQPERTQQSNSRLDQQAQPPDASPNQAQQPGEAKKDEAKASNSDQTQNEPQEKTTENDRMLFVMPNYLTVRDDASVKPLSWKEKFKMTAKGAFDPYEFVIVGVLSGIRQAQNSYPAFGQGMAGYGRRYGTAFADQVDGNMMVGAVYPSILRTDPRYYQLGKGGFGHRFLYAFGRIFVTRKDSGGNIFNIPEFAGNASAIGISTLYYPAQDRGGMSFVSGWGVQIGVDAFGNELKEFWPDLHRMWNKRKEPKHSQ